MPTLKQCQSFGHSTGIEIRPVARSQAVAREVEPDAISWASSRTRVVTPEPGPRQSDRNSGEIPVFAGQAQDFLDLVFEPLGSFLDLAGPFFSVKKADAIQGGLSRSAETSSASACGGASLTGLAVFLRLKSSCHRSLFPGPDRCTQKSCNSPVSLTVASIVISSIPSPGRAIPALNSAAFGAAGAGGDRLRPEVSGLPRGHRPVGSNRIAENVWACRRAS